MGLDLSLLQKFSILSFIILLILGGVLGVVISKNIESYMEDRAKVSTAYLAELQAARHMSPETFMDPDYAKNRAVFETYFEEIRTPEIVRIKIYNRDGRIIYSNVEELIGQRFQHNPQLAQALQGTVVAEISRNLKGKEEHLYELGFRGLMEIYVPIYFNKGEVFGVVEVYQILDVLDKDIAQAQRTMWSFILGGFVFLYLSLFGIVKQASNTIIRQNIQLEKNLEDLKDLDRMKDELISNVSHELKTPIAICKGTVELAMEEDNAEKRNELLALAADAMNREERIVNDLISVGELRKRDKGKIGIRTLDIGEVIEAAVRNIRVQAEKKNIRIKVRLEEDVPRVKSNFDVLLHILNNLLDNAVKFNREGGEISVEARPVNGQLKVTVSDTGIGVSEENLKKIFEKFYQVDGSITRRYGGTGLGLAVVKKSVESLGGEIRVESSLGKGSKFTFTLPISRSSRLSS
jgi:signal transduction histidine kinase